MPIIDENLTYDYTRHRYILTRDAIYKYLGINFASLPSDGDDNPSAMAFRFASKVSDVVYRYLTTESLNPDWLVWELAVIPQLRPTIFEMLIKQAEYMATSGNLEDYSGVDIFRGKAVGLNNILEVIVAPAVKDYANRLQPCLGRSLKFIGNFGGIAPDYMNSQGEIVY